MTIFDTLTLSAQKGFQSTSVNISLLINIEILATIVFFLHKNLFLGMCFKKYIFWIQVIQFAWPNQI